MSAETDVPMTCHGRRRLQQRGMPTRLLSLVLQNADIVLHAGNGCETHGISRDAIASLIATGNATPDDAVRAGRFVALLGQRGVVSALRPHRGARGRCYRRQMATVSG